VDELHLAALPSEDRTSALSENDNVLAQSLEETTAGDSYTIVFLSTTREPTYEPDFVEPVRMDLKRHTRSITLQEQEQGNKTEWDRLPLFEKYQFFTPGIFMAIITTIVMLSILGVGLRALGGLEVSYAAFEKDMGPAAQRKNQ